MVDECAHVRANLAVAGKGLDASKLEVGVDSGSMLDKRCC